MVTGEAVVVEVRVAQLPSRAVALVIDMAVQFLAILGLSKLLGMLTIVTEEAATAALTILLGALVMVGYPVIFETLSRGRSLGKLALGLRVVGDDGGPERFRQAMFRGLAGLLEFWLLFGAPALIGSLISERGKRLGDVFAGTIVISERAPRQAPPPEMPPPLAAWAATLELSRLPEGLAATARQYLARWHDLAPVVRHEMGVRIAGQFASYVSPPPPPMAPPYAYLAAVLAERRRRTLERLTRQAGSPPSVPHGGTPYPQAPYTGTPSTATQYAGSAHAGSAHAGSAHAGPQYAGAPYTASPYAGSPQPAASPAFGGPSAPPIPPPFSPAPPPWTGSTAPRSPGETGPAAGGFPPPA
ncbi:hypothetical protein Sme01_24970 [Sphaerisporangium melleum]|nr:hypothetical protein Sme01_24970 [Sphaerisporangium melleum]